jgi:hypothetical protein
MKNTLALLLLVVFTSYSMALYSQNCSHGATASARTNKLYLYFPTSDDNTFVSSLSTITTNPLAAFDIADLDNTIGSTTNLRDRIFEIVTEDFCEFNVEVIKTTAKPNTTGIPRWQIVGIGSDAQTYLGSDLFGVSTFSSNAGDADAQDYTRVWAGSFEVAYGSDVLGGSNSTLERWARAIASTTSHEAAHNYGVGHCDATKKAGEDSEQNHIMNTSSPSNSGCTHSGVSDENRAANRRHFSDQSYEVLAHNVGLNIMTVYNWDFINPNAEDAHSMELTLLSSASTLSIGTWWNGSRSPWRDPSIAATGTTETLQGTAYNKFILTFELDKSWVGGADGIVPGGAEFHTGAGFSESSLVILYDTKLKDSSGNDLDLHPRMAGFNAGSADLASGDFAMMMYNPDAENGDLVITDLTIQYLPRFVDINTMLTGVEPRDLRGELINPHSNCTPRTKFELSDQKAFRLAKLNDDRFVDITYDSTNCITGPVLNNFDMRGGEVVYCPHGSSLSLFPATSTYVTATVTDPNARYYDRELGTYVNGPLSTKVFYQFAGIVPDFNENGTDDLIDIREGTSVDENQNGVPDEVDPNQQEEPSGEDEGKKPAWWVYLIWIILALLIMFLYNRQRK